MEWEWLLKLNLCLSRKYNNKGIYRGNIMKAIKKIILTIAIILAATTSMSAEAAKVKLNVTNKTLKVGQTYTIKLSNNKSKAKWSTTNKKIVKITKSSKKSAKVNPQGLPDIIMCICFSSF